MRSFQKASLCDETVTAEQSADSFPISDNMVLSHIKPCKHEPPFAGITGLVRRSFPRLLGRINRKGLRDVGESNSNSSSFRGSRHNDQVIDEVKKAADHTSSASSHVASASTGPTLKIKTLDEELNYESDPAALVKDDMILEVSRLEDLLKSSMSPTKLLSRNFPLTSTHGSSLGSMGSNLSSTNLFDDQSSSNYDNYNVNESMTFDNRIDYSKVIQNNEP